MTDSVRYAACSHLPTIGNPDQEEEGTDQEGHGAVFTDGG
jgi:hypothetical protein